MRPRFGAGSYDKPRVEQRRATHFLPNLVADGEKRRAGGNDGDVGIGENVFPYTKLQCGVLCEPLS